MAYCRCRKCWTRHAAGASTCSHCGRNLDDAERFVEAGASPPGDEPRLFLVERSYEDVTIIELHGSLLAGRETKMFEDAIQSVLDRGGRKVLLAWDLAYGDDASARTLLQAFGVARKAGAVIKLVHLHKRIGPGLQLLTQLMALFESFDDEAEPLRSFKREQP